MLLRCGHQLFSGIAGVFFDKDGTLTTSETYLVQLGHQRLHSIVAQVPSVRGRLLKVWGLEDEDLDPAGLLAVGSRQACEIAAVLEMTALGYPWVWAADVVQSAFLAADQALPRKASCTPLLPGIWELLQTLRAANLKLGILSADTPALVADFVDYYQLADLFHLWMGSETQLGKPDPHFFWQACRVLEVQPYATLMIGDAAIDIQMGRAAGTAGCVGVTWGWNRSLDLLSADVILTHPQQLVVSQN
ncbi:hypothetical protein DO97_08435 [Neosynechococcus sphagnicola sy1]|uniref:HAD family hydrolase n=1 Tax=Neosynechococcus sphagnicola sy1 TaxID=1497020 RepID=A0A098TJM9_9CYAN|nr:HAD family hydrolase [Neosynechococcus sphagnicola]KGF72411.1 hypothetical protein DO97_08435 [Neosynechococcus sphagnicola sy1]